MKVRNKLLLSSIVVMFILGLYLPTVQVALSNNTEFEPIRLGPEEVNKPFLIAYTPHDPIVIDSDENFTATALAEGWPGNGSTENPFIIEGLEIDLGGATGFCIAIGHTRVNFTIRDCNITGADPGAGISLYNVSHGRLVGNILSFNDNGIDVGYSWHVVVEDNICFSNNYGIYASDASFYNTINDNNCSLNSWSGIYAGSFLGLSVITNNTCNNNSHHGIESYGYLNTLTDNNCSYNMQHGMYFGQSHNNTIESNTCSHNSHWGIFVQNSDFNNLTRNKFSDNDIGIYLDGSDHNLVEANTCLKTGKYGSITLSDANLNIITGNTCNNGSWCVRISYSNNNSISQNSGAHNQYGIELESNSDFNNISRNVVTFGRGPSNFLFGSEIDCEFNRISWNVFSEGLDIVQEYSSLNDYNYNFYSDYVGLDIDQNGIGDTAHTFVTGTDPHPLTFWPSSPSWVDLPDDQVIELGVPFRIDMIAESLSPLLWSVNDPQNFDIYDNGTLKAHNLAIGTYQLKITVSNIYAHFIPSFVIDTEFTVSVEDTTPPQWVSIPSDQALEYGESLVLPIHAVDGHEIAYWALNDTVRFTLTSTDFSHGSSALITNAALLEPGVYWLRISVYDLSGNSISSVFSVTVNSPPPAEIPLVPLSIGAGIGAAVVLVVVAVVLRKKS